MSDAKLIVVEKVRKLLALSKSSNQHEAELAAAKASELMQEYQIEFAEVETKEIRSGKDSIEREYFEVPGLKMKLNWVMTVGHAAAVLFDGTVLINKGLWGTSFTFVGFKSDIPVMKSLFEHLYSSWQGICEHDLQQAKNRGGFHWTPAITMKYKHGHGQGYAEALLSRCARTARERKAKVEAISNSCTALVLVRDQALTTWKESNGIKSAKVKQTTGSYSGRCDGQRAGNSIALGGALTNSTNHGGLLS